MRRYASCNSQHCQFIAIYECPGPLHTITLESFLIAGVEWICRASNNDSCTLYDSRRFVVECRSESLRSIGVSVPRFRGYFPLWRLSVPALHASASCLAPPLLSVVCL